MEAFKYSLLDNLSQELRDVIVEYSIFSITDALGRIEYANKDYCKILEYNANMLIGETHKLLKSHLHADKIYKDLWRTIRAGKKWNGVLNGRSATGKQFWLDTTIIPVKNELENTISYVSVYNDITKCYSQNIQLIETNNVQSKYRSIFEAINVSVIIVADNEGNITEWNRGAELTFGYSKAEIIGYPLAILINKKIRNITQLLRTVNKIKDNESTGTGTVEMFCLRKNGDEFPVEFTLNTLSVNGSDFYCAIILDITKRKKAEDELKEKTKGIELFLYRITHDLKAPFSTAEGLVGLLEDEVMSDQVESLAEMLETTIRSGKKLVENLSQTSICSNKTGKFKKIDFNCITDNVLKMLSGSKNFELFTINVHVSVCQNYNSNPEWINSIFQNLIQNAIKYSKEPTIEHCPFINVSIEELRNEVIIKISDNGRGISENEIEKIFDLHYRSTYDGISGSGLGLYIVKNIVENLGGKISVKSEINKGTKFKIKLPINK